jgi:TPR repeat protein
MGEGNNNIGGGYLNLPGVGMLRDFWNDRVRTDNMKSKEEMKKEEHPVITLLKATAEETKDPFYYLLLGNIYLTGNSQFYVKSDIDQAIEYYEIAADLGSEDAMAYVGLHYLNLNQTKSYHYLSN